MNMVNNFTFKKVLAMLKEESFHSQISTMYILDVLFHHQLFYEYEEQIEHFFPMSDNDIRNLIYCDNILLRLSNIPKSNFIYNTIDTDEGLKILNKVFVSRNNRANMVERLYELFIPQCLTTLKLKDLSNKFHHSFGYSFTNEIK